MGRRSRTSDRRLAERAEVLRATGLFGGLVAAARRAVAAELEEVSLPAGEVLFEAGDEGDALYVVVRGRLRSFRRSDSGEVVLGESGPGDVVGEIAVVSARPRLASVRAVRDSRLLRLSRQAFEAAVADRPTVLTGLVDVLVDRLDPVSPSGSSALAGVRTVTLVPAGGTAPGVVRPFARALARSLRRNACVEIIDLDPTVAAGDPADLIEAAEARADVVLLLVGRGPDEGNRVGQQHADRILLVADVTADPAPHGGESTDSIAQRELVLLQPSDRAEPRGTEAWIRGRDLAAHHQVRVGSHEDCRRLARSLEGRSVALVLGGGGPRGFAHIGAVKALREAGVPIDMVVGTSIGSLMAVGVAYDWDAETMAQRAVDGLAGRKALLRPTLPLVSLSSGRRVEQILRGEDYLGDRRVEDAAIRWFCVSTSLRSCESVVHDRGPAWHAVRASMALPGILPPVFEEGDLLVDGGVLDNVPVDVAKANGAARVVAVDLEPVDDGGRETMPFDPSISGWQALARRLGAGSGPKPPTALGVLLRTKQVAVINRQAAVLAAHPVDVYLRPPLDSVGALDFRAGLQLIEVGYRYTIEALARLDLTGWA